MTLSTAWQSLVRRPRSGVFPAVAVAVCWTVVQVQAADPAIEELQINQLQFIGTHNSYHVRKSKSGIKSLNYTHAPLDAQLDHRVRSFELDLHYRGGQFEIFHVPKLDEGTTVRKLKDALEIVRKWSDAHPHHLPISILFEAKKASADFDPVARNLDADNLDQLDETLRSVFPAERCLTPDDVRGKAGTLREAILSTGWPKLAASRGKVFFILHDDAGLRDLYEQGHPSLRGRVMFVRSSEDRDDGAVLVLDNPRSAKIVPLVKAGYMIRTRADADLHLESAVEPARRDAAFASGAQIVSTDFPAAEAPGPGGYTVKFPDNAAARVDPVNGPEQLRGKLIAQ